MPEVNALQRARMDAALERMRDLGVTAHELFAYTVAQGAIEITRGMQEEDPEVDMPETCEAYLETEEESLNDTADAWLSYLLNSGA